MNQRKKSLMSAQANSNFHTEAAIKLLPQQLKNESDDGPIDKDGFDGDTDVMAFDVQIASNGFFVTVVYVDIEIPDERFVVQTMDEVVEILRGKF